MPELLYRFLPADTCNFCGSASPRNRLLGRRLNGPQGLFPSSRPGITVSVQECVDCGLVYPNPLPLPIDIGQHYDVPPEEYWNSSFFASNPAHFERELTKLKSLMRIVPGMKSLDIGSGIGKAMVAMAKAGFDSYGLEPSASFRKRSLDAMAIPGSRIQLAAVETAKFDRESFDFISFGAVLEHLADPSRALQRAIGWLRPNGIVHVEVPSSRWLLARLANQFYKLTGAGSSANLSPMSRPFHLYEFHEKSFQMHGKKFGYRIAETEYFVCDTYLPGLLSAFSPLARAVMRYSNSGMQLTVWLTK